MNDWLGLPEPSSAVLQALKGIHPGLYVVRCRYLIEQSSGFPKKNFRTGELTERPRYWVWIDHRGRKSPLFPVETPEGEYMPVDMRLVRRIATDISVVSDSAEEMCRLMDEQDEKREEKRVYSERECFRRVIENNGPLWRRALENARRGLWYSPKQSKMRDPLLYSYNGQPIRSSSHGTVPMSAKERGLDLPEK